VRAAVRRKFEAHVDIRAVLLGTGDEDLLKNAPPRRLLLGLRADGSGRNMLGLILMEVRAALRGPDAAPAVAAEPGRR
jgi:predicted NAD-dependent protein-ADP-ribosyltransferase YbiA (DUF1768 family)